MTDLVPHQQPTTDLTMQDQWKFAQAVASGDNRGQSILPDAYKGNPANVMIAVGLGASMGLSPAESLYRISVIKGKPSAGAELIAANVRRAGHKLRVKVTENPPSATAQIIRADDPDFPFEVTRDMDWAKQMGLASEFNYKKQPATMLQWRAITAVARLACPEALYGVAYTPDEVGEAVGPEVPAQRRVTAAEFTNPTHEPVEPDKWETVTEPPAPAGPPPAPTPPPADDEPEPITDKQLTAIATLAGKLGLTREQKLAGLSHYAGRTVDTSKALTKIEATWCIDAMKAKVDELPVEEPPADDTGAWEQTSPDLMDGAELAGEEWGANQ